MRKKAMVFIIIICISISGCSLKKQTETDENDVLKVVENYNTAIYSNDWNSAEKLIDGYAKTAFAINRAKYSNNAKLISQKNVIETSGKSLCIVSSKIDSELTSNGQQVNPSRRWIRYFLKKNNEWKIVKVEEQNPTYPKIISEVSDENEIILIKNVVGNFIKYSAEGNISEASKLLTGNLLENAQKYKIDTMPKSDLKNLEVLILGYYDDEVFVDTNYAINGKRINSLFHLIKIKGTWLISDKVS